MENGSQSIPGRRTDHSNALWQKSHGECNMKEASGTPVEKAAKRGKTEKINIYWLGRAFWALLRDFYFIPRSKHLMIF